jgi:soluble lytic murein transglycosylase-like protein
VQPIPSVPAYVASVMLLSAGMPAFALDTAPPSAAAAPPSGEILAFPADETKASAPKPEAAQDEEARELLGLMIELAAKANDLPLEFFVRVIWQESRFQSKAVGPVTRKRNSCRGRRASVGCSIPSTRSGRCPNRRNF